MTVVAELAETLVSESPWLSRLRRVCRSWGSAPMYRSRSGWASLSSADRGPGKIRSPPKASPTSKHRGSRPAITSVVQQAQRILSVQVGVDDGLHVEHVHRSIPVDVGAGDDPRIGLRPQEHIDA